MLTGTIDLLNEVSISKITGEENIFSKKYLYDFQSNIEGTQKIYEVLKSHLDKKLSAQIEFQFKNVNALLKKYSKSKSGYDFIDYDKLTENK